MNTVTANKGVSSCTTVWTSLLFVNNGGNLLRKTSRTSARNIPSRREVNEATIIDIFAVLGCPAPSSFDTLMLPYERPSFHIVLIDLRVVGYNEYLKSK